MTEVEDAPSLGGNFRAEDLSREELEQLTVLSDRERAILTALESTGQRLLIGPRGSGKSTYLKLAYFQAIESANIFPVYVNYSKSISLEPELRRTAHALAFFRQWLLAQIISGARESLGALDVEPVDDDGQIQLASDLVSAVERRRTDQAPDTQFDLTGTLRFLESSARSAGRRRVVLLLDDAAHAFSPEQQREFFEVFGALRSRAVSAKAAVYPGVTSYTPRFHVGHDAQLIDVWLHPETSDYLRLMRDIAQRRLDPSSWSAFSRRENLLEYVALASFGIPRTFISMLSQMTEDDEQLRSSKALADIAIQEAADNAIKVFTSLESKLPRFKNFVSVGLELVSSIVDAIGSYNDRRVSTSSRARVAAISLQEPLDPELQRILGFLEYAGLVRQRGSVNNGGRNYRIVSIHYALLLSRAALALGRNPSVSGGVEALSRSDPPSRLRRSVGSLLGSDYLVRCRLNLGACSNCGAERESAEARFCANCGARLEQVSVYEELLDAPIDALPISDALLGRIREHSDIRKIEHVLLDEERQALLKVKYIGPVRADRIRGLADEFVYE